MRKELSILADFPPTPHEEWLGAVEKQLKGKPFEKALVKKTYDGVPIQPMYFKRDLDDLPHVDAIPGFAPYVRGTKAAGNKVTPWDIAQEITEPDPDLLNKALVHDLNRGQNVIHIKLDKAAKNGHGPDTAPTAEVGKCGVSVAVVTDVENIFENIEIPGIPVHMETGFPPIPVFALLMGFLKQNKRDLKTMTGCIGSDPMETLISTGTLPVSLSLCLDQMAALTQWGVLNTPNLKTIVVNGGIYRNAGANAVQEIAFSAATGVTYVRELMKRGIAVNDIGPRILFHLSIGTDFFMEIAKFRAARMVWHNILEAFGADDTSRKMHIHAGTLQYHMTKIDPWVNMLRVTTETFSGIAGGCDSLHVSPFDEVIRKPNEFSRRIARNVQILLREEAHFDKVTDPAGGSWYIENITWELAQNAWKLFQEVEGMGGMITALKEDFPQTQVGEIAAARAKNAATRKDTIVGTNMYPNLTEKPLDNDPFDHDAFQKARITQLNTYRERTDKNRLKKALATLAKESRHADPDIVEKAVAAAMAGASIGELTENIITHRDSDSITPLKIHRVSEPFERLREQTEAFIQNTGKTPKIFMANMGPLARHKPRSDFSTAFFSVAGYETIFNDGFQTPEEAAEAAAASNCKVTVICGTDDDYMEVVPPVTKGIKTARPDMFVMVAGYSPKYADAFKEAGVDEFIHVRANALGILQHLQQYLLYPEEQQ